MYVLSIEYHDGSGTEIVAVSKNKRYLEEWVSKHYDLADWGCSDNVSDSTKTFHLHKVEVWG